MNNNIFYHLLCLNDGVERFKKTYDKIKQSGLINDIDKIYVNCVGKNKQLDSKKISDLEKVEVSVVPDVKFKTGRCKQFGGSLDVNESSTINQMRDYAISNKMGNSLYLHSKGASKSNKDVCLECINAWVDYMEYFLIERYVECLEFLKKYDTCGCNLVPSHGGKKYPTSDAKHYCGNFYWATNELLAKTKKCWNHVYYPEHYFLRSAGIRNHKEFYRVDYNYRDLYTMVLKRETYEH